MAWSCVLQVTTKSQIFCYFALVDLPRLRFRHKTHQFCPQSLPYDYRTIHTLLFINIPDYLLLSMSNSQFINPTLISLILFIQQHHNLHS